VEWIIAIGSGDRAKAVSAAVATEAPTAMSVITQPAMPPLEVAWTEADVTVGTPVGEASPIGLVTIRNTDSEISTKPRTLVANPAAAVRLRRG
jgi:hypothetical protein